MKIKIPLHINIPRVKSEDKKIMLNMNVYRNLHHMTNNKAKTIFKELISSYLSASCSALNLLPPYRFTYTLYQASNRSTDIANILSIVDKFTCDALVELGVIKDDNCKILSEVVYRYGGVDKEDPRAELEINQSGGLI